MRTPLDALRSTKRYVALALGPDWEVRLAVEKGTFNRPQAQIIQIPSVQTFTESWHVTRIQTVHQVMAYPAAGQTAEDSLANALDAVELLAEAYTGPGVGAGYTARVPLYDYAGIPLLGPESAALESDRKYNDFMKLEQPPNFTPYQDPQDEMLWSVMGNITMSWLRNAAVRSGGPTAVSVTAEYDSEG